MSWIIAALAAALNAGPALAGGPDAPHGGAGAYTPVRPLHDAPHADPRPAPYAGPAPSAEQGGRYRAPRTVQLSPHFFHGPLTGGVARPPVQVYAVRQVYVTGGAPFGPVHGGATYGGPVSAGQAAAVRGLGQGGSR
ncbi:hypothetical protein L2D00_09375 [Hyphomonadaceae bacterium BL14]|nr:hypothetical protein L2D00_09375 [Hyphomonadaceae bacterium BL14]